MKTGQLFSGRMARWGISLLVGALFLVLVSTTAAEASPDTRHSARTSHVKAAAFRDVVNIFQNRATSACIDESFAYGVRGYGCNDSNFQKWNVHIYNDATRQFRNLATGRCLDDSLQYGLRTFGCNNSEFQSWDVETIGHNLISLSNQATGRCLDDSNEYGLRTYACHTSNYQAWS